MTRSVNVIAARLQGMGAGWFTWAHNHRADGVVTAALREDAQGIAISS
jgi:methylmalonyl-CoA mutase cobalamin-binding subunit